MFLKFFGPQLLSLAHCDTLLSLLL
jgi:hypothetical protein